ncbi:hypothetical protein KKE34_04145 [Patescibacteria group bacterium]|nr:hypothetical protein [Patescibacteria group bacterium]
MERTFIAELDNSIRSMRGIQRVVDEISKVNFEGRVDSSAAASLLIVLISVTNDVNPSIAIIGINGVANCNECGVGYTPYVGM